MFPYKFINNCWYLGFMAPGGSTFVRLCVCVYECLSVVEDFSLLAHPVDGAWNTLTASSSAKLLEHPPPNRRVCPGFGTELHQCTNKWTYKNIRYFAKLHLTKLLKQSASNCADRTELPDSLSLADRLYRLSLLVAPLVCSQSPHRVDVCKSLLVD